MPESKKPVLIGGAFAAFAVYAVYSWTVNDDPVPPAPAPSPSASVTIEESDASSESTPEAAPEPVTDAEADLNAARAIAVEGMTRYSVHSWRDEDNLEWIRRTAQVSTDGFRHRLLEMYDNADEEFYWREFVVKERVETRIEIDQAELGGFDEHTDERKTFTVFYTVSTSDVNYPEFNPGTRISQWVSVVKTKDGWRVDDIRPTGDRS